MNSCIYTRFSPPPPTPVIINTPVVLIIFRSLANSFDLYDMYSSKILCTRSVSSKCGVQYLLTDVWCSRFKKHNNIYICMICTFIYSELVKKIYVQLHCMFVYVCVCIYIFTCSSLLRIDCE